MIPGERHIEWSDVREVAQRRGRNSEWPAGWDRLAALWLPGWDGLNSHDILGRYHMTAVNTPTRSVGALGPCILFDDAAPADYLIAAGAPVVGTPLTMACWFLSDSSSLRQTLMAVSDTDIARAFRLEADGAWAGDPISFVATKGADALARSTTGYGANQCHHACGVSVSADVRHAYCDGGSKGSDTSDVVPTELDNATLGILAYNGTLYRPLSGRLMLPTIWSRALSDAEVKYHYDRGWWEMLTPRPEMESMYVPSGEEPAGTPWLYAHRRSARIVA